jgi:hypothetical protein
MKGAVQAAVQLVASHKIRFWSGCIVCVVVAFILAVVRPFGSGPQDLTAQDLAKSWNDSISRLGILPVYPPEEDFHVGDVWAVVAESDSLPLLGQAVRLAHIDLRADIAAIRQMEPIFADTTKVAEDAYRHEPATEVSRLDPKDDQIVLSLAAFPGITITHAIGAGAGLGGAAGSLGAGRGRVETEEITIPIAETYGAPAARSFARLDAWCSNAATKLYCTDEYARRVLAFSVNGQVMDTEKGAYTSKLQLRLVDRVFLTREIQHKRVLSGSHGGFAAAGLDASHVVSVPAKPLAAASAAPVAEAPKTAEAATHTGAEPAAALSGLPNGRISFADENEIDIELNQVFQRPVVFGYRAVTITLPPSTPSAEAPP